MDRKSVENGIAYLLHTNDCVIIPGFGGLIANYESARMDSSRGLMFPPSKDISFNPALTRDDGLLANHLSGVTGMEHNKVKSIIDSWVSELKTDLKKNKSFLLPDIGEFRLDQHKKINFLPVREENFLATSYGLAPVSIITESRRQSLRFKSSRKISRKALVAIPAIAILATVSWFGFTDKNFQNQLSYLLPASHSEQVDYRERYPYTASEEKVTTPALLPSQKDPNALFLDLSDEKEAFLWPVKSVKAAPEKAATVSNSVSTSSAKLFHVVTGCFAEKENAERHIRQMKKKGLDASIAGFEKGLYRVSAGSYSNHEEAAALRTELKESASPGAWIWNSK